MDYKNVLLYAKKQDDEIKPELTPEFIRSFDWAPVVIDSVGNPDPPVVGLTYGAIMNMNGEIYGSLFVRDECLLQDEKYRIGQLDFVRERDEPDGAFLVAGIHLVQVQEES